MSDYKQILGAVQNALGVIVTATNLPGVNLIPYVSTVATVAKYAQIAIDAGSSVEPYIEALAGTFNGQLPTEAQLADLDAKIEAMHAQIQGFNPVAEAGEDV